MIQQRKIVCVIALMVAFFIIGSNITFAADQTKEGYILYFNGKEVGHEPNWNAGQAVSNFRWNTETKPSTNVTATFNGVELYYLQPGEVSVLPVFFVSSDQEAPTQKQRRAFDSHLRAAQNRYEEMLSHRDKFEISSSDPLIYRSTSDLSYYQSLGGNAAAKFTVELFNYLGVNRFNCPYIFLIIVMNDGEDWPAGGGTPFNGGVNLGGGVVVMSSYGLAGGTFKQATLQHELGHSFGLVHVDRYGYDMASCDSIMSYNQSHHWNNLTPPETQGILIPEDLRLLAENKLVLPDFYFDPLRDVPDGYTMGSRSTLSPMNLSIFEGN